MDREPTQDGASEKLPREAPDTEDLLGFCKECFRVRWLRRLESYSSAGMPEGACRSCARDAGH